MHEEINTVKPYFFSPHAFGEFLVDYLDGRKINNAFLLAEDGDMILNLLAHKKLNEIHACDNDPHSAMTLEMKKNLILNSDFEDSACGFCGGSTIGRLKKIGRWHNESFDHHLKRETHARYLRTIEEYYRLKTQLEKLQVHIGPVFKKISDFGPNYFDVIYLGRIFDEPRLFTEYNWPDTVSSRLVKNGHMIIRSDQPKNHFQELFKPCGFGLENSYFENGHRILVFGRCL